MAFIDSNRARRVAILLAIIWLLALADLGFTIWAHLFTPLWEANPIAHAMLDKHALGMLVAYKLLTTAIGSMVLWHVRDNPRAELGLWGMVLVYVLLAMRWSAYTTGALALATT